MNKVDKYGKSALYEAIVCRKFDAGKALVLAGAKVLAEREDLKDYLFR